MIKWKPDTCDCEIEYSGDFQNARVLKSCKFHVGKTALDVLNHNKSFNLKYGSVELSKEQLDEIINNKKIEKERIKNL